MGDDAIRTKAGVNCAAIAGTPVLSR
jgi:hypothetical protein